MFISFLVNDSDNIDEIITAGSNTDDSSDDKPGLFYSCLESFLSVTK